MGIAPYNTLVSLVLCCFRRGGSSLLWSAFGSFPDVWMMENEWHRSVYARWDLARRLLHRGTRAGVLRLLGTTERWYERHLRAHIKNRMLADLRHDALWTRQGATFDGAKLMDHNIWWLKSNNQAFSGCKIVVLTREPFPQCESLLLSRLSLKNEQHLRRH